MQFASQQQLSSVQVAGSDWTDDVSDIAEEAPYTLVATSQWRYLSSLAEYAFAP